MEPTVYTISTTQTMINIVGITGLDRMSPGGDRVGEVAGVNCFTGGPPLQVLERLAEIFQNLAVDEFNLAPRSHGCHESRNSVDDQAKTLLALALGLLRPF